MSRLTAAVSPADHRVGPENAGVTLVEYGDYQCPYCGEAYPIVNEVKSALGDRLRFVFRNFPLVDIHPHAQRAAEVAEAAAAQGKFWEMHDLLFENQKALGDRHLIQYAQRLGLDARRIEQELEAGTYADRVSADVQSGIRSGVNGTPTFFINGRRLDGPWDFGGLMAAVVEAERNAPSQHVAD